MDVRKSRKAANRPRTADEVIDRAIEENRFGERLLYAFAILFVIVGLILITIGVLSGNPVTGLLGLISNALFFPAMWSARRTRQESVAIRLLQAPLMQADTSKEAAEAIRVVFIETFAGKANAQNKRTPEP